MATKKEIKEHLKLALSEIGEIKPWFDSEVNEWVFENKLYPVGYGGTSPEEVIKNYPRYLTDFIEERLNNNLSPLTEKATKGRGGKREGAGRPLGSNKELSDRISLPHDIALWFKQEKTFAIQQVRQLMHRKVA